MTVHNSLLSVVITVATTAIISFLIVREIHLITRKLNVPENSKNKAVLFSGIFLFGWLLLAMAIGLLDFFHVTANFISPLVPVFFALPIIIFLKTLKKSELAGKIADSFTQPFLILIQVPRIGGYVFLVLMEQGLLPAMFAIPSGYGDIIVGLSAPIVAFFYLKKTRWARKLAIAWNVVGIIDLAIAISFGIGLVFPEPFQIIPTSPTTELMTTFPLVMVPAFAVPLGMMLHILSLRLLLKRLCG